LSFRAQGTAVAEVGDIRVSAAPQKVDHSDVRYGSLADIKIGERDMSA
jgi:hypothetical protein